MPTKKELKRELKELRKVVDFLITSETEAVVRMRPNLNEGKHWCVQCEDYCECEVV